MGKLTDKALRAIKPQACICNIADGDGLSLEVWPNGGRYWRFRYRFAGKAKRLSLGVYPEVSLKEARDSLTVARATLRGGVDPSRDRKEAKQALLTAEDRDFSKVAADWLAHNKPGWASETCRKPAMSLSNVCILRSRAWTSPAWVLLKRVRRSPKLAARAPALAQKARGHFGSIAEFAIHSGCAKRGGICP
ncbi:Arm DNA-binding domain-containing protein [Lysobacter gummosus]|uniref:Arm DNA-binding domain-containing protein n=1 Tax=Lysobacter gummosus TaxID=262324 RepID=A0ABY3XHX9_9GAMM|nr:Arm DNA-binding domain-containing protein [Lysobacter gummosus]UNP31259.1 Arm DNA-binding domain-containing protein [Lysobacter gummosus]